MQDFGASGFQQGMRKWICAGAALVAVLSAAAQPRGTATVSGYITDLSSSETLIGAGVLLDNGARVPVGAVTNPYGYYTLSIPKGDVRLQFSYVGYESQMRRFSLQRDTVINITLAPSAVLSESRIVASKDAGIQSTYLGAIEVPLAQIQNTPVIFGEADVLKAIQMMPGVQGGTEGTAGLYVRGGGPDENLILMDGVPIYNVDHMLGLFSVFQPEAVKKVTLYKGSFPARYGGRVSSIIDIRTNDGNMKETRGSFGLGVVSQKFHLEGPILKDKLSYSLSARGMHTAIFAPVIKALMPKGEYANYFFYDLTGKLSWRLSDNDRFFLGAYSGRDKFGLHFDDAAEGHASSLEGGEPYRSTNRSDMDLHWGNDVASLRWNHLFSNRLFANTTVSFNRYKMHMGSVTLDRTVMEKGTRTVSYDIGYRSGIRDWSGKIDFDYVPMPDHLVKFGAEYIYHTFIPETLTILDSETDYDGETRNDHLEFGNTKKGYYGHDISLYVEDDISVGDRLSVNPGVHMALFLTDGKPYWGFQPRLSAKYAFFDGFSCKAGYARMAQYVHLLCSAQVSLPIDLWVPITRDIRPVTSDQYSAGFYYDGLKGWEFSVEGYYKDMRNILEYKDGTLVIASSKDWEKNVEMGQGRAMGVEFFAQKTAGKLTGWLAYTLAKSERRFPDGTINMGEWFPYKYDRRHSVDLSVNYAITRNIEANATWSFASGGTTTLYTRTTAVLDPEGSLEEADFVAHRNNYRLPPSHRLNLGISFHHPHRRWGEGIWNLSVYNVYNRMNPNFVYLRYESVRDPETREFETHLIMSKITLLPILPAISYTFKF